VARAPEIDQLRAEKSAAEQRLVEQQRKAAEDENRNADALAKLKDSFQLAENAIVDRDQVFEPLSSVLRGEWRLVMHLLHTYYIGPLSLSIYSILTLLLFNKRVFQLSLAQATRSPRESVVKLGNKNEDRFYVPNVILETF